MFPKNLDRIVARVTLHLTPELGAQHAPEPLLGAWMMNYMWEYLIRTQVGIVEVKKMLRQSKIGTLTNSQ